MFHYLTVNKSSFLICEGYTASRGLLRRRTLFSDRTFIYLLLCSKFPFTLPLSGLAEAPLMPTGLDAKEATHHGVHQCAFSLSIQTQLTAVNPTRRLRFLLWQRTACLGKSLSSHQCVNENTIALAEPVFVLGGRI